MMTNVGEEKGRESVRIIERAREYEREWKKKYSRNIENIAVSFQLSYLSNFQIENVEMFTTS